jgi:hypothetical protein
MHSAGSTHTLPVASEQVCPAIGLATHVLFIDEQKASPRHW